MSTIIIEGVNTLWKEDHNKLGFSKLRLRDSAIPCLEILAKKHDLVLFLKEKKRKRMIRKIKKYFSKIYFLNSFSEEDYIKAINDTKSLASQVVVLGNIKDSDMEPLIRLHLRTILIDRSPERKLPPYKHERARCLVEAVFKILFGSDKTRTYSYLKDVLDASIIF